MKNKKSSFTYEEVMTRLNSLSYAVKCYYIDNSANDTNAIKRDRDAINRHIKGIEAVIARLTFISPAK